MAKCPAHRERTGSLSITDMGAGHVRLHCFAGCSQKAVLDALGLVWRDLRPEGRVNPHLCAPDPLEGQRKRAQIRWWIRKAAYWRVQVEGLGKALMQRPESDKMARQFHQAVERRRVAQAMILPYFHRAFVGDADL